MAIFTTPPLLTGMRIARKSSSQRLSISRFVSVKYESRRDRMDDRPYIAFEIENFHLLLRVKPHCVVVAYGYFHHTTSPDRDEDSKEVVQPTSVYITFRFSKVREQER